MNKKEVIELEFGMLGILDEMTDEQAGQLFKEIYNHKRGKTSKIESIEVRTAFIFFRNSFLKQDEKHQLIIERNRQNGKGGGRKKKIELVTETPKIELQKEELLKAEPKPKAKREKKKAIKVIPILDATNKLFTPKFRIKMTPFPESFFEEQWLPWITYKKKEWNFEFKTIESEQTQFSHTLMSLSGSDVNRAEEIIKRSISNKWKGLQPLPTDYPIKAKEGVGKFDKMLENGTSEKVE